MMAQQAGTFLPSFLVPLMLVFLFHRYVWPLPMYHLQLVFQNELILSILRQRLPSFRPLQIVLYC